MSISTDLENTKMLQYVFAHEYVHIRRFDSITKLVLITALCMHWFNPLVWAMYVLANRDIELSCDEAVIHKGSICAVANQHGGNTKWLGPSV